MMYLIMIMKLSLGLVPMQFATFNWLSTHPSCHHIIFVIGILDFFLVVFCDCSRRLLMDRGQSSWICVAAILGRKNSPGSC